MKSYVAPLYLLVFLPAVVFLYNIVPKKLRPMVLLLASYLFFWSISGKLILFLLISTFSIHHFGLWLSSLQEERNRILAETERPERKAVKAEYIRRQRWVIFLAVCIHIGTLLVLKYTAFFGQNLNSLLALAGGDWTWKIPKMVMPIGISFYTMQAMSYILDVYRETLKPDKNIGRLALYMAFFPSMMEGPICRYNDDAVSLWEGRRSSVQNLVFGAERILYGVMKKMVIADRLNIMIKTLYSGYADYDGGMMVVAAIAFTCQLYMEFSGTMDVVIGSAELFGIVLPENFKRPFFSKSISEFWTRWHITLGTWFRDYIFYPISMSKPMKRLTSKARKKIGNHFGPLIAGSIALFVVWLFNGLWHGAGWHYICFGMYHFVLIASANAVEPYTKKLLEKLHIRREEGGYKCFRIVRTALLVCIGELIFRAGSLRIAMRMLKKMFTDFNFRSFTDGTLLNLGMDKYDFLIVAVSVLIVLVISIANERGICIRQKLAEKKVVVRWAVVYGLILFCIIFGAYGMNYTPVDPIYAGF